MQNRTIGAALARKLEVFGPLSTVDAGAIEALLIDVVDVRAGTDLVREGEALRGALIVLKGMACRMRLLPGGQRQISAFLLPGDLFGLHDDIGRTATCGVSTLAPCTVARVSYDGMAEIARLRPVVGQAMRATVAADQAVLQEWLVNVGRRTAYQRIAHLLCELLVRFRAIGAADGDSFDLSLTQYDVGDTVALSVVHVNRIVQQLRHDGLIRWDKRRVDILDSARLATVALFDPAYLRLDGAWQGGERRRLTA